MRVVLMCSLELGRANSTNALAAKSEESIPDLRRVSGKALRKDLGTYTFAVQVKTLSSTRP